MSTSNGSKWFFLVLIKMLVNWRGFLGGLLFGALLLDYFGCFSKLRVFVKCGRHVVESNRGSMCTLCCSPH